MTNKRFLILGAAGQTGFELVKQSAELSHIHSTAVVHSPGKVGRVNQYADEAISLDYQDTEALQAALSNVDVCYLVLPRNDDEMTNAIKIIDLAKQQGVKHIIYLSGLMRHEDKGSAFQTKRNIQQRIVDSGMDYTFLCPTFFMQRALNLPCEKKADEVLFYATVGDGRVPFIDAYDIAATAIAALDNPKLLGQSVNLTSSVPLAMSDIVSQLSDICDIKFTYVDETEADFAKRLEAMGLTTMQIEKQLQTFKLWRADIHSTVHDDFQRLVGRPQTTFESFLQREKQAIQTKFMEL